jgi:hypothetical protein
MTLPVNKKRLVKDLLSYIIDTSGLSVVTGGVGYS